VTSTVLVPDDEGLLALAGVAGARPVRYEPGGAWPADGLDAEIVVVWGNPAGVDLAALPRLKLVQTLTSGVEQWRSRLPAGVALANARGAGGAVVAEWVLAVLLALSRDLPGFQRQQEAGRWDYRVTTGLIGAKVLVFGAGDIGLHVRSALAPLQVDVKLVGRTARPGVITMARARPTLGEQDAVVLAIPLDGSTRALADAGFLARMRDGAILVNAGRGGLVDTDALVAELTAGRLRAALDVTDPEPLPAGHPLWGLPGVLLTPHVGTATLGEETRCWAVASQQLAEYLAGRPPTNLIVD
jgi:phosphoglycerate dehydrogenase-like enzyme